MNYLKKQLGLISSTPEENLFSDLQDILQQVLNEEESFKSSLLSEGEKEKRLMYLFIRDLLPGLNGKILSSKDNRQSTRLSQVSISSQYVGWLMLFCLNGTFLFYIYLFDLIVFLFSFYFVYC